MLPRVTYLRMGAGVSRFSAAGGDGGSVSAPGSGNEGGGSGAGGSSTTSGFMPNKASRPLGISVLAIGSATLLACATFAVAA